MGKDNLQQQINHLIDMATGLIDNSEKIGLRFVVSTAGYHGFRSAVLSFIIRVYGEEHPYYITFSNRVNNTFTQHIESGLAILRSIETEIENNWLGQIKETIAAEIFSDFLESSEHLISQGYKDAAAVLVGSTLEKHLKDLSIRNGIEITTERDGKTFNIMASDMNVNLYKNLVYNKIMLKQVEAFISIRNDAAHGNYDNYDETQVSVMLEGVRHLISTT